MPGNRFNEKEKGEKKKKKEDRKRGQTDRQEMKVGKKLILKMV